MVQVLWPPRKSEHKARAFALLEVMEREIARDEALALARDPGETEAAVRAGQIAVLLSMEGAHGLGAGPDWAEVFDQFYDRGLRLVGITWSFSNRFAGSSGDGGGGLTDEGRALVAQARAKRVISDVSHASRQTTMEICRDSPQPVIASHSNAHFARPRTTKPHGRGDSLHCPDGRCDRSELSCTICRRLGVRMLLASRTMQTTWPRSEVTGWWHWVATLTDTSRNPRVSRMHQRSPLYGQSPGQAGVDRGTTPGCSR